MSANAIVGEANNLSTAIKQLLLHIWQLFIIFWWSCEGKNMEHLHGTNNSSSSSSRAEEYLEANDNYCAGLDSRKSLHNNFSYHSKNKYKDYLDKRDDQSPVMGYGFFPISPNKNDPYQCQFMTPTFGMCPLYISVFIANDHVYVFQSPSQPDVSSFKYALHYLKLSNDVYTNMLVYSDICVFLGNIPIFPSAY